MLKALGIIINLIVVLYLGYQAQSCLTPELMADFNSVKDLADFTEMRNPLILSFVAVVGLYFAGKN